MFFALGSLLLTTGVVFYLLQPLVTDQRASLVRDDDEMTETEARRRVTLMALRDVEYDYLTGKLDDEDYGSLKRELSSEALTAMAEDDTARAGSSSSAEIEREIAAVRAGLRSGTTCPSCGYENPAGSRFCSGCGTPLAPVAVG